MFAAIIKCQSMALRHIRPADPSQRADELGQSTTDIVRARREGWRTTNIPDPNGNPITIWICPECAKEFRQRYIDEALVLAKPYDRRPNPIVNPIGAREFETTQKNLAVISLIQIRELLTKIKGLL